MPVLILAALAWPATAQVEPDEHGQPVLVSMAGAAAASPQAAMTEVAAVEADLALRARTRQTAAQLTYLAAGGRIYIQREPLAKDRRTLEAQLDSFPAAINFTPVGGEASKAGDLAWTYGAAAWLRDGQPRGGHYVRIWQKQADGWKLTVAQLPPKPASAPAG